MSVPVGTQESLGIGKWTSTAEHALGFTWQEPAHGTQGPRTYMYVKFTKGSGADAYDGSPVGFIAASMTDALFTVAADASAVLPANTPCGVIRNTTGAAVTTNYYGWIQLFRPWEVVKSCIVSSDAGVNSLLHWTVDSHLDKATAYTSVVEAISIPVGGLLTGFDVDGATAYVSSCGYGDVLGVVNAYIA